MAWLFLLVAATGLLYGGMAVYFHYGFKKMPL
jgi:hypothetical protein